MIFKKFDLVRTDSKRIGRIMDCCYPGSHPILVHFGDNNLAYFDVNGEWRNTETGSLTKLTLLGVCENEYI